MITPQLFLTLCALDPSLVEASMAPAGGAELDWDKTIDQLLKG